MAALDHLRDRGLTAERDGDRLLVSPASGLTDDDRQFIRDHKRELIIEVERQRRRNEILMKLAENPSVKYAYAVDTGSDPVILAVAIRDLATFELEVPANRYDGFKLATFLMESEA